MILDRQMMANCIESILHAIQPASERDSRFPGPDPLLPFRRKMWRLEAAGRRGGEQLTTLRL